MIDLMGEIKPHFLAHEFATVAPTEFRCPDLAMGKTPSTMKGASAEIALWSSGLGTRLRLLQAGFEEEGPELREQLMAEEVERTLETIPVPQRDACLERIAAEFPSEDVAAKLTPAPGIAPANRDVASDLVERLLKILPDASEDEVAAISKRLANSRLHPATPADARFAIPEDLQNRIDKLVPNRKVQIDHVRALRMLDLLVDLTLSLDQLVWQVWKSISPKGVIQPGTGRFGNFRKCIVPFLTGDPEISADQVEQVIASTRKLVSGLLAAMGTVGETYAAKFTGRLSPAAIKQMAEAEAGVFDGIEKKCWRKYVQISSEFSASAIEKELLDIIKRYTEKLVLGADAARDLGDEQ